MRTIAFIGLGAMGMPMARRLLQSDFAVRSCANVRRAAIDELKHEGLVEVDSPAAAAAGADATIVMVRDEPQTDTVINSKDGVLAAMTPGSILVLMSTLSPSYCIALSKKAEDTGIALLDAPVSGLPARAAQGSLTLMVGGDGGAIERFQPAFDALGTIHPCGGIGMGMVAKLANNLAGIGTLALVCEATAFAKAHGMEPATLLQIMAGSTGDSFAVRNWDMVKTLWPDLRELAIKDLMLCCEAANEAGVTMPLGEVAGRYPWSETL